VVSDPAWGGPARTRGWSRRRRRTLAWLAGATVVLGAGAFVLPAEIGVTAGLLAGLCGFLLVAALVVFLVVPGPDTAGTLLRSLPLAASVLVVAVLLVLSTAGQPFRWVWLLVAGAAAVWTAVAVWETRRAGGDPEG
jgi:hypothetical protein